MVPLKLIYLMLTQNDMNPVSRKLEKKDKLLGFYYLKSIPGKLGKCSSTNVTKFVVTC